MGYASQGGIREFRTTEPGRKAQSRHGGRSWASRITRSPLGGPGPLRDRLARFVDRTMMRWGKEFQRKATGTKAAKR